MRTALQSGNLMAGSTCGARLDPDGGDLSEVVVTAPSGRLFAPQIGVRESEISIRKSANLCPTQPVALERVGYRLDLEDGHLNSAGGHGLP
jgi:hypothetical protein